MAVKRPHSLANCFGDLDEERVNACLHKPELDHPFLVVVGNHDHYGYGWSGVEAQMRCARAAQGRARRQPEGSDARELTRHAATHSNPWGIRRCTRPPTISSEIQLREKLPKTMAEPHLQSDLCVTRR